MDNEKVMELATDIKENWNGYTWEEAIKEARGIIENNEKYEEASNYYR